ncbi:GABA transporter 1-like [Dorcoceras hygrometricum]|uniref:GABA transporter 1-like n=1 Tax=Dorcoceras hygrometricum TaxID=472368 RepID=A0A2Z7BTG6_9LAMI|nr:GABA transporter 1-like [Dorcoceras hygrometricum]
MFIGSLATLDLPIVVDMIGIFELKGPYCTLSMTDWFFQALSVIPRGSWGDVSRRFTMIRLLYYSPPPFPRRSPPPVVAVGSCSDRLARTSPHCSRFGHPLLDQLGRPLTVPTWTTPQSALLYALNQSAISALFQLAAELLHFSSSSSLPLQIRMRPVLSRPTSKTHSYIVT